MNNQFDLGRTVGYLEATVTEQGRTLKDHGLRLSKLEERPRPSIPWKDLLPYAYGIVMIIAALVAVLSGKLSAMEAISVLGKGP